MTMTTCVNGEDGCQRDIRAVIEAKQGEGHLFTYRVKFRDGPDGVLDGAIVEQNAPEHCSQFWRAGHVQAQVHQQDRAW